MNDRKSKPARLKNVHPTEDRDADSRLVAAVQQFLSAREAGEAMDRDDFAAQFPEFTAELKECLEGLELVHQVTPELCRSPGDDVSAASAASRLLGDYRLLREIGRGGMGVVYEAVQISLNRRVAVKVLPFAAAIDRKHLQRFRNEAQAAAQLHHTNIVPVYAVGEDRGTHFYAMQLIDGEPLSHAIAQMRQMASGRNDQSGASSRTLVPAADRPTEALHGDTGRTTSMAAAETPTATSITRSFTPERPRREFFRNAAELMRQAASALDHAHQFGVVHRDIKPANLLIDAQGTLWVTDFGLAHIQADATLTRTGDVLGTLGYMSPEQASGNRLVLDHRTDIYSLGVTFYEMLALKPLFPEGDRHSLLRRIIEEEPRPLRRVDPEIPVELEIVVGKAIAKDPNHRYATAKQLADDLQRWINDEPILARPPTRGERMRKWSRRHRSLVRTAGGFLFLSFLGLLGATILIAREHAKTKAAYEAEMQQRMAADNSFRQARQAVDTFTRLGEEELGDDPGQRALRRKILDTALEYYRSFLDQRHDDPGVQAELTASSAHVEQLIDELAVLEGYGPLMLLSDKRVADELGLTAAQREEIEVHLSQISRERHDAAAGRRDEKPTSKRQQLADILRSHQQAIAALLSVSQMSRLKQVAWQRQGPFVFENAEIAAALQLTAAQRARIAEIIDEEAPGRIGGPGPRRGPPDDFGASRPPPERRRPPRRDDEPRGLGPPGRPPERRGPQDRDGHWDEFDPPPPPHGFDGGDERRGDFETRRPPRQRPGHGPGERPGGGPRGDHFLRDDPRRTVERIVATLSDEQRQTWLKLVGEPLDADPHDRPEEWPPQE